MMKIKKAFEGTKVYNDVVTLIESGKVTFDMVDLNCGLYVKLISLLDENNIKFIESNNINSAYCRDFKLV